LMLRLVLVLLTLLLRWYRRRRRRRSSRRRGERGVLVLPVVQLLMGFGVDRMLVQYGCQLG